MKELIILIVMMFPDYGVYPDSVAVSHFEGKPLVFNNEDKCEEWIWNDLENLKEYGLAVYPEAVAVKSISCVHKGTTI
jgi:hypothetical protein|tara:strand:- start:360 stop:593 length:234 start_codon:yes stop_codon:yes gene_type:complete